jgi:hypothetical protein
MSLYLLAMPLRRPRAAQPKQGERDRTIVADVFLLIAALTGRGVKAMTLSR